jgi:hypothetical protein
MLAMRTHRRVWDGASPLHVYISTRECTTPWHVASKHLMSRVHSPFTMSVGKNLLTIESWSARQLNELRRSSHVMPRSCTRRTWRCADRETNVLILHAL